MNLNSLTAISPIDGRYRNKTEILSQYFSEFALIKYRLHVEVEYFIALCELQLPQLKGVSKETLDELREIALNFDLQDADKIKEIEKTTNHDVKAVEYFLKEKFDTLGLSRYKEFIHFGLTSQDINNTSIPLSCKDCIKRTYNPLMQKLIEKINNLSSDWKDVPMLAHTHGQPASPTRLGKEFKVFAYRLSVQFANLQTVPFSAKFGGATGNYNAHNAAYPEIQWKKFGDTFVSEYLKLHREQWTTQISNYDNLSQLFDALKRINTILLDFNKDVWQYISMNYFKQKVKKGEIGSSAMPHKVNPIDFENAEGNLGIANALLDFLSAKLPISRLQRDLTDSTVLRNIGVPFGHIIIAIESMKKGLDKLILNEINVHADLENSWTVVAEAIQTILRREGYPNPYEALKELTRGKDKIDATTIANFIDTLDVNTEVKDELKNITPHNYTGI